MSFLLYHEQTDGNVVSFEQVKEVRLVGRTNGLIVHYLRRNLKNCIIDHFTDEHKNEHYQWTIQASKFTATNFLESLSFQGNALLIHANPNNKKGLVSLFKLEQVWGYSAFQWTPIMLKLKEIFVERDITQEPFDLNHFQISDAYYTERQTVYTHLYLGGWIENNQLMGSWNFPNASPTNSVFLWRYATDFFSQYMRY